MSTATAFAFLDRFPFCVVDKSSSDIGGITDGKLTFATLTDVMEFFWNLEGADFTLDAGPHGSISSTTKTGIAVGRMNTLTSGTDHTAPNQRVCQGATIRAANDFEQDLNLGTYSPFASPFLDFEGESTWMSFGVQAIYYNTDTDEFVVICRLAVGDGPAGIWLNTANHVDSGTSVSNGGTCTIFGQTQTSFKSSFSADGRNFSIGNPSYYTY